MEGIKDWLLAVLENPLSAQGYLTLYGLLALSHVLVQYTFALLHDVRVRRSSDKTGRHRLGKEANSQPLPKHLAVWVPVYQEKLDWLEACLAGAKAAAQYYVENVADSTVRIIVIDDGSFQGLLTKYSKPQPTLSRRQRFWNAFLQREPEDYRERYDHYLWARKELDKVLARFRHQRHFVIPTQTRKNAGKRHAQQAAWTMSKGAGLYVTVDSDTVVDPDAFLRLAENFRNPRVAAATGYVDVGNWDQSWLTRLIDMRYWSAFHVERAAQSFWRCVMCCSGPLAAYRASVADLVMGRYATQQFLDQFCTFGDDRHLTNLILEKGYEVVMDPRAHCLTDVPTKVREYIPQQERWSKSFFREMLWSLPALRSHSKYMTYDLTLQAVLPFMLLGGLGVTVYLALSGGGWNTIGQYVVTIFAVGFLRSLFPFFARRNIGMGRRFSQLLFMGYGVIHVTVLIPVRLKALWGLFIAGSTGWGTRQS